MKIIDEYKKRFFILLESEMGDVKPITNDTEESDAESVVSKIEGGDFESLNNMPVDMDLAKEVLQILSTEDPQLKEKLKNYIQSQTSELSEGINKRSLLYALGFLLFSSGVAVGYNIKGDSSNKETVKTEVKPEGSVSFENAQKIVKIKEGGYQKNRNDAGNYIKTKRGKKLIGTKYGIAAPTLQNWFRKTGKISKKETITSEDMKNLDYQTATEIFKNEYWDKNDLDVLNNQSFANLIYDGVVIHGPNGMAEALNQALENQGLESPSGFSNKFNVINDLDTEDQEKLFNQIKKERNDILLSQSRAERRTFGKGWDNRLNSFVYSPN